MLILDAELNGTNFLLISFYNSNTESLSSYLVSPLYKNCLKNLMIITKKNIVFGSDFNLIFDCKFDPSGGNPILKKKSLAQLIGIKESLYFCDIWRIRNPNVKRFTFRQNCVPSFVERRRLDFFLISNILQESIIKLKFLLPFVLITHQYFFLYN